jgi:subtilisin-like proprotein convertase family protein
MIRPLFIFFVLSASPFVSVAAPVTFSSANLIVINDSTNPPTKATPYPSSIVVTGLTGVITKVTVQIFNFSHDFPDDADLLLVGPQGQDSIVFSNVGGDIRNSVTNVTVTIDPDAAAFLPSVPPLVSGTFKPTKRLNPLAFDFPTPAPVGSASAPANLSAFNGTNPNGTWNLYIVDDAAADAGMISGGWSITLDTAQAVLTIVQSGTNVIISWPEAIAGYTLETTPSLLSANWSTDLPPASVVSGRFTITNSTSDISRFYRLIK